jgi:hypothetical protein
MGRDQRDIYAYQHMCHYVYGNYPYLLEFSFGDERVDLTGANDR